MAGEAPALKLEVESLDDVPEALRPSYTEGEDGKFHLALEGLDERYESKAAIAAVKSAVTRERQLRAELEKKLAEQNERYKDLDLERYKEMLAEQEKREHETALAKGQVEEITRRQREAFEKKEQAYTGEIAKLKRGFSDAMLNGQLQRELSDAGALPKADKTLIPLLRDRCRVEIDDETSGMKFVVLDEEGQPAYRIEDGKPMTPRDLVLLLKADETIGRLFEGNKKQGLDTPGRSGTGATTSAGGGGGNGGYPFNIPVSKWPPNLKSKFIADEENGGLARFRELVNREHDPGRATPREE
jgi:hypothetical protein